MKNSKNTNKGSRNKSGYTGSKKGPRSNNSKQGIQQNSASSARANSETFSGAVNVPGVSELVTRFPFDKPTGTRFTSYTSDNVTVNYGAPGFCKIYLHTTFGNQHDPNSALNRCAVSLYQHLRAFNGGKAENDPNDIILATIGMANIIGYINWEQRIYGLLNTFSVKNKYVMNPILNAMGVDVSNVRRFKNQLLANINEHIRMAAQFSFPAGQIYTEAMKDYYSSIILESDTIKDQMYFFQPAGFYRFRQMTDKYDGAGYLEYVNFEPSNWSVDQIYAFGNSLFVDYYNNDSMSVLCGDIEKAFQGSILQYTLVSEDYETPMTYNPAALEQIRNITFVENTLMDNDLYQSSNKMYLECNASVTSEHYSEIHSGDYIMTSDNSEPTTDEMYNMIRLHPVLVETEPGGVKAVKCGGFYASKVELYLFNSGRDQWPSVYHLPNVMFIDQSNGVTLELLTMTKAFQYLPTAYVGIEINGKKLIHPVLPACNVNVIAREEVSALHEIVELAMFMPPFVNLA